MLSVCLLTCNSERMLNEVLNSLLGVADEIIVVDSGSTDSTLSLISNYNINYHYHAYTTHAQQMNYAISLAENDWVLCMDSDEILDQEIIGAINDLKKSGLNNPRRAYRIPRYWYVLNQQVRSIYPVSSPDYPVRLFNRLQVRFNHQPVDDSAEGADETLILPGRVRHDTFYSLHEMFNKLNAYTSRVVKHKRIRPSLLRGIASAIGAMFKWYFINGSWRDGRVGFATGVYAVLYSFLKYFKAWFYAGSKPR